MTTTSPEPRETPDEAWAALWAAVGDLDDPYYSGIELRKRVEAAMTTASPDHPYGHPPNGECGTHHRNPESSCHECAYTNGWPMTTTSPEPPDAGVADIRPGAPFLGRCGCPCPCHHDEALPEWPGSCAACCDPELGRYVCRCIPAIAAAYGTTTSPEPLRADTEAALVGMPEAKADEYRRTVYAMRGTTTSPEPPDRQALIDAERALNRLVPLLPSTARVHEDYRIIRAALGSPVPTPANEREARSRVLIGEEHERAIQRREDRHDDH